MPACPPGPWEQDWIIRATGVARSSAQTVMKVALDKVPQDGWMKNKEKLVAGRKVEYSEGRKETERWVRWKKKFIKERRKWLERETESVKEVRKER